MNKWLTNVVLKHVTMLKLCINFTKYYVRAAHVCLINIIIRSKSQTIYKRNKQMAAMLRLLYLPSFKFLEFKNNSM